MSNTYLFLQPASLPLLAGALDAHSVGPIAPQAADAALRAALPALAFAAPATATGETDCGWVEFSPLPADEGGALCMRCSMRGDYEPLVQALCDRFGWVAFDQAASCFQPGRPPMQA